MEPGGLALAGKRPPGGPRTPDVSPPGSTAAARRCGAAGEGAVGGEARRRRLSPADAPVRPAAAPASPLAPAAGSSAATPSNLISPSLEGPVRVHSPEQVQEYFQHLSRRMDAGVASPQASPSGEGAGTGAGAGTGTLTPQPAGPRALSPGGGGLSPLGQQTPAGQSPLGRSPLQSGGAIRAAGQGPYPPYRPSPQPPKPRAARQALLEVSGRGAVEAHLRAHGACLRDLELWSDSLRTWFSDRVLKGLLRKARGGAGGLAFEVERLAALPGVVTPGGVRVSLPSVEEETSGGPAAAAPAAAAWASPPLTSGLAQVEALRAELRRQPPPSPQPLGGSLFGASPSPGGGLFGGASPGLFGTPPGGAPGAAPDAPRLRAELSQALWDYTQLCLLLRGKLGGGQSLLAPPPPEGYLLERCRALAVGGCMMEFCWDGAPPAAGGAWKAAALPSDSELAFYLFGAFLGAPGWAFPPEGAPPRSDVGGPLLVGSLPPNLPPPTHFTALLPHFPKGDFPAAAMVVLARHAPGGLPRPQVGFQFRADGAEELLTGAAAGGLGVGLSPANPTPGAAPRLGFRGPDGVFEALCLLVLWARAHAHGRLAGHRLPTLGLDFVLPLGGDPGQ